MGVRVSCGVALVQVSAAIVVACSSFSSSTDDPVTAGDDGGSEGAPPAPPPAIDAPSGGSYRDAVLADRPAAYFELEALGALKTMSTTGTYACDVSGGGVSVVPSLVMPGTNAFAFDGTGYLDCGGIFDFVDNTPFTIEAWIRPNVPPADAEYRRIVAHDDTTVGLRQEWALLVHPTEGIKFERTVDADEGSTIWPVDGGPDRIGNNDVHHVVGVYDGSRVALWVDGQPVGTYPSAAAAKQKTTHLFIGANAQADGFFLGVIDEVAIYESALTATQIQTHFKARR